MNKVLFVEDGSVDVDELQEMLPEVPIIIYRQGSLKPEFVDVDTLVKVIKKEPCAPESMCKDKADPTYTPEEIGIAINNALSLNGKSSFSPELNRYDNIYTLSSKSVASFIKYVFQELNKMNTSTEPGVESIED